MKANPVILIAISLFFCIPSSGQNPPPSTAGFEPPSQQSIEKISVTLTKISQSLQTFNNRLDEFLQSLNKYKGVQLSEQQQKLLFGYEVLNQTEQLCATLRKSLMDAGEKEASLKRRLRQNELELSVENINKSVALLGTTHADEARENRKRSLEDEKETLQRMLTEVEAARIRITEDLRAAEYFARSFKGSLFAQIKNELANF